MKRLVLGVAIASAALVEAQQAVRPRIAPLAESAWTDEHRQIVRDLWQGQMVPNDVRTYLLHPILARDLIPFEAYISGESTLIPRHRALLILRTAWLCRSQYVWARHAGSARRAGLGAADLRRIAVGADDSSWDASDAVLLRAADELHVSSFVSDATWRTLTSAYNTQQAMDAIFTVAEFTMVSATVNSLGVEMEPDLKDRLPADVPFKMTVARSDERLIGKAPRIPPLDPSDWTPDVRHWLDPNGSGRAVANIYRTYARHLKMDVPRTSVSEHIRQRSTLSPRIRELLIVRIGVLCKSEYEWAAHAPALRRAGSDADIDRVVIGPSAGGDPLDVALLQAADDLYRDDVISDTTWNTLVSRLDARQLLDMLTTIGGYRMVSMALNSLGVQLEPNALRFPPSLRH